MSDPNNVDYTPPPRGTGVKIPILFGAIIALLVANVYLFLQLDQTRTEMASLREVLLDEVSNLREASTVTSQTHQRRLETMREEMEAARREASMAAGQAKVSATKRAEELHRKLQAEQRRQQQQVQQELGQVTEAMDANRATIGEVKSTIDDTVSELDKTISALRQVTGDLGLQSGLIATNASELAALKALGDRNYYEFDITKTRRPVKVGDIAVKLKNTEAKKNRFAIEVVADDKQIEKKYRTVNEPLQFYVAGVKQPYELVINEVHKNRIVGYLATPKVKKSRKEPAKASS